MRRTWLVFVSDDEPSASTALPRIGSPGDRGATGERRTIPFGAWAALGCLTAAALLTVGCWDFQLSPTAFAAKTARFGADELLAVYYRQDLRFVHDQVRTYIHRSGTAPAAETPRKAWARLEHEVPGARITVDNPGGDMITPPPFIYESADAPYLTALRAQLSLDGVIAGAETDFDAILLLSRWVGRQFDHGLDAAPGGHHVCDPTGVVLAGRAGHRFSCEIAARLLAHAAMSVGLPARVLSVSRDGYTPEHALTEIWSDRFNKWIAVDPDFNILFENTTGTPQSAVEVMGHGADLPRDRSLVMRRIAPPKPHTRDIDTLMLYRYVSVDMRTDWCSRILAPGSPAGGDLATWWTARPDLSPLLTARHRVTPEQFGWTLNAVTAFPLRAERTSGSSVTIRFALAAYAPAFMRFEYRIADGTWRAINDGPVAIDLPVGRTELAFRVLNRSGFASRPTSMLASVER